MSVVGGVFIVFALMALCYRSVVVHKNYSLCLRLVCRNIHVEILLYAYIYIYIYTYIYICMYVYIYIYIYIYTYIYVCMYIYAHIYVCHIIFLFFYDPHVVHIYLHVYLLESVLYYRLSLLPFPLTLLFVHFLLFSFLSLSLSLSLTHSLTLTLSLFLSRCIFFYRADQALCIICAAMSRSVSLRIAPYIRYTPRLCDRAKIDTRCNEQRQHRTKPNRRDIETRATRNRPIPFAEQEMRPSIARLQHAYRT